MATTCATIAPSRGVPAGSAPGGMRLDYVDGLRALAALYVVIHHCWLEIWPFLHYRTPSGPLLYLTGWLEYGHFAVSLFIVLSGLCLSLPLVRAGGYLGGALHFYLKRARRILPPYYCALAFSLLLIWLFVGHQTGTHWDMSVPVEGRDVLMCVLLLEDIVSGGKVNHAFWSIAVEWRIYLLFPLMLTLSRAKGTLAAAVIVVLVPTIVAFVLWLTPIGQATFGAYPWLLSGYVGFAPSFVALFGLGMLAAGIAFSESNRATWMRARVPWATLALAFSVPFIAACWMWPGFPFWSNVQYGLADLNIGLIALCALVAGSRSRGPNALRSALAWRPLVFVGGYSYSLYLIHAPLIQVVWQYLIHPLNVGDFASFVLLVAVGLPFILAASYVFYLVCERPFIPGRGGAKLRLWPFRGHWKTANPAPAVVRMGKIENRANRP